MDNKGFSIVEVIIALSILGGISVVGMNFLKKNPTVESRSKITCVDGYKFVNNKNGLEQIKNANGGGVRCGE